MARHRKLTQKFTGFPLFKLVTGRFTYPLTFSFSKELVGLDGLSLDLQFAADKTLTARTGPTPVFTRGSTATFFGGYGLIQSAAVNAPRFDHDPITGVCKGLLIEESRTNTMLTSEQFDSASWNAVGLRTLTVTANDTVSPSGFLDADRLTVGATTTSYRVVQNTANVISGTAYTFSCFLKANQVTRAQITAGNTVTLPITANFDLTGNGSVVSNTFGTASIQNYGNGWYRCIITGTAGANSNTSINILPVSGTSTTYPGNSVDSFYAWGAQLEAGAFVTSYIPTVASSVVRSADVCSITGSDFTGFYNPVAGSVFTDIIFNAPTVSNTGQRTWELASATTLNSSRAFRAGASGLVGFRNTSGATTDVSLDTAAIPPSQQTKQSFGLIDNDFAFYSNGAQVGIDTSCSMPASLNAFYIGSNSPVAGGAGQVNGTISAIRYYKKRLPDAKLSRLTV